MSFDNYDYLWLSSDSVFLFFVFIILVSNLIISITSFSIDSNSESFKYPPV